MQSTLVKADNFEGQNCTICLLPLVFPVSKLPCDHIYCLECLLEWCKSHNTCPLCSQEIHTGFEIHEDGSIKEMIFECKKAEKEMSLDCLDHGYFKQEIAKLLRLVYELEVSRFKQRNSKGTPSEWRALQGIRSRLETLKLENESFVRFIPEAMLDEVYCLSEDIDNLKIGIIPRKYEEKQEVQYYDDYSDEDYD